MKIRLSRHAAYKNYCLCCLTYPVVFISYLNLCTPQCVQLSAYFDEVLIGPGCSKLMASLVKETLKFQTYYSQKCSHFFTKKKCEEIFQQIQCNTATIDFVSTVRLIRSSTNDLVKLMMLLTTGPRLSRHVAYKNYCLHSYFSS